jgi:hypothetical protein
VLKEIIAVCSENDMKNKYTLWAECISKNFKHTLDIKPLGRIMARKELGCAKKTLHV